MPGFLKGSVFVKFLAACFNALARAYRFSRLKGFVGSCALCLKDCMIYRLCSKYFNKPYYFEYSLTLRFIKWLVRVFDVPMSLIGRFVRYITGGSDVVAAADALAQSGAADRLKVTGIIGVFISLGFCAGVLLKGGGAQEFAAPGVLFVLSLVILGCGRCLGYIKNSVIYRFIVWLVKA